MWGVMFPDCLEALKCHEGFTHADTDISTASFCGSLTSKDREQTKECKLFTRALCTLCPHRLCTDMDISLSMSM